MYVISFSNGDSILYKWKHQVNAVRVLRVQSPKFNIGWRTNNGI